ncbi:MAG: hypothetical protein ACLGIC_06150 [Acidimicrobiia bacterium]
MTDPLLTIEDATREFRVSPKTIRRRLAAGEIEGAYKRPGSRGPEWVMPRTSLAGAGFVERSGVGTVAEVPADDDRRADYWERRAKDAEDALAARTGPLPKPVVPERRRRAGVLGPVAVAATAVIALVAVAVVLLAGGDDPAPEAADAADSARGVLSSLTEPGDEVGFLGPVQADVLPPDRAGVPVREAEPDGPRYLVAVVEGDEASPQVQQLAASSSTVLRLPQADGWLLVFDTGEAPAWADPAGAGDGEPAPAAGSDGAGDPGTEAGQGPAGPVPSTTAPPADDPAPSSGAASGGDEPAAPAAGSPSPEAPATEPPASDAPAAEAPAPDAPAAAAPAPTAPDRTEVARPASVQVEAGESFWSIATELAEAAGGSSVEDITQVWAELVDANADRLVEPGNPDLLHVGQTLIVPSP